MAKQVETVGQLRQAHLLNAIDATFNRQSVGLGPTVRIIINWVAGPWFV